MFAEIGAEVTNTRCIGVSQPSSGKGAGGNERFARPGTQVELQTPMSHDTFNVPIVEHARPQAPQFAGLFMTSPQPVDDVDASVVDAELELSVLDVVPTVGP